MTWQHCVPICFLLLGSCASASDDGPDYFPNVGEYEASPLQERVDRSFSDILILTPLDQVRSRLTEIRINGCEDDGECEWRDAEDVRHYLWADEPFEYFVVVKIVQADEFEARPIRALDIGLARERDQVLKAARRFIPAAHFDCSEFDDHTESCSATLRPGWVRIYFDSAGSLSEVKFDGYHFT